MRNSFSHHSATVKCQQVGESLRADYTGSIGQASLRSLSSQVTLAYAGVTSGIARLDHALTLFNWGEAANDSGAWSAPTALIVRDDQLSSSLEYCANMLTQGFLRQSFLQSEQELAQVWADCHATLELSRQRKRERQASELFHL